MGEKSVPADHIRPALDPVRTALHLLLDSRLFLGLRLQLCKERRIFIDLILDLRKLCLIAVDQRLHFFLLRDQIRLECIEFFILCLDLFFFFLYLFHCILIPDQLIPVIF